MRLTGAGFVAWFRGSPGLAGAIGGGLPRFAAFPASAARPGFRVDRPLYQLLPVRWRNRHGPGSRDRWLAGNSGTGEVPVTWVLSRRTPVRHRRAPSARRLGITCQVSPLRLTAYPGPRFSGSFGGLVSHELSTGWRRRVARRDRTSRATRRIGRRPCGVPVSWPEALLSRLGSRVLPAAQEAHDDPDDGGDQHVRASFLSGAGRGRRHHSTDGTGARGVVPSPEGVSSGTISGAAAHPGITPGIAPCGDDIAGPSGRGSNKSLRLESS